MIYLVLGILLLGIVLLYYRLYPTKNEQEFDKVYPDPDKPETTSVTIGTIKPVKPNFCIKCGNSTTPIMNYVNSDRYCEECNITFPCTNPI